MVQAKIMRRMIHQLHQFRCFVDDGRAVAPGKDGGKKRGYFNVLFFAEAMRNRNRIEQNKGGAVVFR